MTSPTREVIETACEVMHDAYELAAVQAGWETQERSRKPWADVPEANKVTMRAAVSALMDHLTLFQPLVEENRKLREALEELVAVVRGECPSLLNEDSGASSRLIDLIDAALQPQDQGGATNVG